jgi:hypothetical protein
MHESTLPSPLETNLPLQPETSAVDEAATSAARGLLNMSDETWDAHQEARYPGTQEIIEVRRGLLTEIKEFSAPDAPASKLFELLRPELADVSDPIQRLNTYEALCEEYFDFRIGDDGKPRERQEIPHILKQSREEVGAALWDTTFEVCAEEGMVESSELADGDAIKCIGILGGAPTAIANRARYALEQIRVHGATVESFDFLVAEGQETDVALKEAEMQLGVNVGEIVGRVENAQGTVTILQPVEIGGHMVPVRILTAKAKGDRARATTLDTMELWGNLAEAGPDDRMVAVTTGLYTAFQKANAREVITWKTGAVIDVIGHSAEWAGGQRTANQLLQEYKAAVDSRYRLYQKMVGTGLVPS